MRAMNVGSAMAATPQKMEPQAQGVHNSGPFSNAFILAAEAGVSVRPDQMPLNGPSL